MQHTLLAISLLVFSIYKPFEKVFKGTLFILTGVIILSTGLVFFQEHLILSGVSDVFGIYKPLITHWPISLMYMILSVCNFSLYSLFIWGFMNRLVSLSEGVKYYIPVTLVLGIAGAITSNLALMILGASKWPLMAMIIPAIIFTIFSFSVFSWSWKRLPDHLIHPRSRNSPGFFFTENRRNR